jgi:hypothetical protein
MPEKRDFSVDSSGESVPVSSGGPVTFSPLRILEVLARHRVDFILIGGVAGTLHGAPILTTDVDVVPALETSNLDRLAAALKELNAVLRDAETPGGIRLDLTGRLLKKAIADFRFLRFTTDHGHLDIIHRPAGTNGYRDLARSAEDEQIGTATIRVAAIEDIIRSKEALGRPRDKEQLPTLRRVMEVKAQEQEETD